MQMYYIDNNAQNLPIRSIVTMRDVTHLMKGDAYFIRNIYGDKHQYVQFFRSEQNNCGSQNDILSLREKEVLNLILKNKDTDEIAEILKISRNTVRNHRQNMLDGFGAKDMTALLELARICHIL
jgi:DNA-binding CsgD family transcriptional regulator